MLSMAKRRAVFISMALMCAAVPFCAVLFGSEPRLADDVTGGGETVWEAGFFSNATLRFLKQSSASFESEHIQCSPNYESKAFAQLADLQQLPPYYFIVASSSTKPLVIAIAFGPPRPAPDDDSVYGKVKMLFKQGVQAVFLALAVFQAVSDGGDVWRASHAVGAWWEGIFVGNIIIATSTNMASACSAIGVLGLRDLATAWTASHRSIAPPTRWANLMSMGPVGAAYVLSLIVVYGTMGIILLLFQLPAALAYCYIYVPAYVVLLLLGSAISFVIPIVLSHCRGAPYMQLLQEATTESEKQKHLESINLIVDGTTTTGTTIDSEYQTQRESHMKTGVPIMGWNMYVMTSIAYPIMIGFFTPVAARLYAGHGYWAALTTTLGERHLEVYGRCLLNRLSSKVVFLNLWL